MALTANSSGAITGKFTIPANTPTGAKLVEFNGAGGSYSSATFVGRGQVTITELRNVQTQTTTKEEIYERYDPLAETFTLFAPTMISGVDIWPCTKGPSGRIFVEIRECSNGVPIQTVLANCVKATTTLLINQWDRFSWEPVRLEAGREYAIVVGCDDAITSIRVAELGKFDADAQQWVTVQPYQVGVLLSSSNASTWTPHQDKDMTFRLLRTPFASTARSITLPPFTMTNADELMVQAAVERPTEACDVVFKINLPDGSPAITISEGDTIVLPTQMTGTVTWSAELTGSQDATPRLHKDIQAIWGQRKQSATYITRSLPTITQPSKISVYFECLLPGYASGASSIAFHVAETASGPWTAVPFVSPATPIGEGWEDRTNRLAVWNGATVVLRVTITGTARQRPVVRKLRVAIT